MRDYLYSKVTDRTRVVTNRHWRMIWERTARAIAAVCESKIKDSNLRRDVLNGMVEALRSSSVVGDVAAEGIPQEERTMSDTLHRTVDNISDVETDLRLNGKPVTLDRDDKESGRFVDARLLEELIVKWRRASVRDYGWTVRRSDPRRVQAERAMDRCADELTSLIPQ